MDNQNKAEKAVCVAHSWLSSWGANVKIPPDQTGDNRTLVVNGIEVKFLRLPAVSTTSIISDKVSNGNKICPRCGVTGSIETDFGYRHIGGVKRPQSWCRSCRTGHFVAANAKPAPTAAVVNPDGFVLDINTIAGLDVDKVVESLQVLANKIGIQVGEGVRTSDWKTRNDDYEAVSMRLTQFVRTVNPPPNTLKEFESIVRREAARAARRYRHVLVRMMGGVTNDPSEDLYSIGMIYFINHYHQYAHKYPDGQINKSFLVHSLRQQFSRWQQITHDKLDSIDRSTQGVPEHQMVGNMMGGEPAEPVRILHSRDGSFSQECEIPYTMPDFEFPGVPETPQPKIEAFSTRKVRAKSRLDSLCDSTPKDILMAKLKDVADNEFLDYETRTAAARRLRNLTSNSATSI